MDTRIEIYRDGLWRTLRLRDKRGIRYNALINKIGNPAVREISHTNTFSLPPVHENTSALDINLLNAGSLAAALNKRYPAKYYVEDKLIQQGFLIINNTSRGEEINVNFIDKALEITEKWGATTYKELINSTELAIPEDYRLAILEMTSYNMSKSEVLTPLTEVGTRGYNLALFPNALNTIGDTFQMQLDETRLDNSFNPYQSRPIWNARALFDLAVETYGYSPIYDSSINWENVEKTYIVESGLNENVVADEGQFSITYPSTATFAHHYSDRKGHGFKYVIPTYHSSVPNAIKPNDIPGWQHPQANWFKAKYFSEGTDYRADYTVLTPDISSATFGNIHYEADLYRPRNVDNYEQKLIAFSCWENSTPGNDVVFKELTIDNQDFVADGSHLSFDINKAQLAEIPAGSSGKFWGIIISHGKRHRWREQFWTDEYWFNTNVTETYLIQDVISYDDNGQYIANNIDLQHSVPNKTLKELMAGIMQKEGILLNIDSRLNQIRFFSYSLYRSNRDSGNFEDWSDYFQQHTSPLFNTDYGNKYAKKNQISLSEPYLGNTYDYILEKQGEDSKYKDFTRNEVAIYKDIQDVKSIANSTYPYWEYKNEGLGLVESTNTISGLDQVDDTGIVQGTIPSLQLVSNVNYATLPSGVSEWYNLIDGALKGVATFLLPVQVIKTLDLSKPIYVEGLGGFFIIEKIEEYSNAQTPVKVHLIKLIEAVTTEDESDNPDIIDLVMNQSWDSEYSMTLERKIVGEDIEMNQDWGSTYEMTLDTRDPNLDLELDQDWSSVYSMTLSIAPPTYKDLGGNQDWSSTYLAQLSKAEGRFWNLQQTTDVGWVTTNPIQCQYVATEHIDFDTSIDEPSWVEGRVFYDKVNKCVSIFDDQSETSLQVGQEVRVRVYNNNGVTVENGAAVTVVGVTAEGIVEVELAIASDQTSALNTIGIATHSIEPSTYGWATTSGFLSGVNTSAYTEGAAIWLSDTVPGAYSETRPLSPSWEVRMGGVAKTHATEGKLYAELRIISNDQDNNSYYNGAILEPNEVTITSNGTTVNCRLNSLAANNRLSLIFDQDYVSVADGINIDLTLGTDSVPVENWVYIDPAGTITVSTSSFPTGTQYSPIARVVVPSAARAQTYGNYKVHAYTDHLAGSNGQGHLSHINAWVRKRPASWQNGVALTQSVPEGTSAATIDLSYTSGIISQLHDHTFVAHDTAVKPAFVVNDSVIPYQIANGITSAIDTDSLGASIGNNKYYNLVVWGVISEDGADCNLFFNLPSGSYTNLADALNDIDTTLDYTIPTAYLGTGFLITKLTLKRTTTQVQVQVGGTRDLRGSIPAVGGGSVIGGAGITTFDELQDTPATKVGSSLYLTRVNVGETELEYVDHTTLSFTESQISDLQAYLLPSDIGVTVQAYNADTVIDGAYVHTDNNYTTTEKNKLAGIEAGAEVNVNADWDSISGDSEILNKPTLNLSNWNDAYGWGDHSLAGYELQSNKGIANGYVPLGSDTKIPNQYIPALAISDTFVVASQAAMLLLTTAETGDVAVRTDENKTYILKGSDYSVLGDWQELLSPTDAVQSVNGLTGTVILDLSWTASTGILGISSGNTVDLGFTTTDLSNWDTAYGWGDHAGLYSLLSHTHTFASLTSKPTTLAGYGISDTKVNYNTSLSDGNFMFVGDAPSAHTHSFASLTSKPTTLAGYGISDTKTNFNTALSDGTFLYVGDVTTFPGFTSLNADYGYTEPTHAWSEITSKPTTIAGFGITDNLAYTDVVNTFTESQIIDTGAGGYLKIDDDYARIRFGNEGSDGDVHMGAMGSGSPTNGNQDYGFYSAYNAYRHTDGNWYHTRTTTAPAVRSTGSAAFASGLSGFNWDRSANAGAGAITWTNLMNLADVTGNLTVLGTLAGSNLSGSNTGDQTSIVGLGGTKAQFNTELSDGTFLYVGDVTTFPGFTSLLADYGFTDNSANWNTAFGWGNHGSVGYLTSETSHADVVVDGDFTSNGIMTRTAAGVYAMLTDNSANWNTAFGWGDHSGLYSLLAHNHSGVYEPVLGNPASDGYILSSTAAGARSWIANSGGATIITQDEGIEVDATATTLNFVGDGVTAVDAGSGVTTITIGGGSGANITKSFIAQTVVVFTHNTGEKFPAIQCWDTNDERVIPKTIVATDINNLTVTFHEAVTGTLSVVVGGTVGTLPNNIAYTNVDNDFSVGQTITESTNNWALEVKSTNASWSGLRINSVTGANAYFSLFENDVQKWGVFNRASDDAFVFGEGGSLTPRLILEVGGAVTFSGAVSASNLSGSNTGDQSSIVGLGGTKAQFNTELSDGTFLYVGDVTTFPGFTSLLADYGFTDNSANWNTAFGWGNHSGLYSLVSHDHSGTYEPADATILKDADIGVNVQAYNVNTTTQGTITLGTLGYTGATDADKYTSFNLKTDSVQRIAIVSGGTVDIVGGTNVTVGYSAGGVVTINSAGGGDVAADAIWDAVGDLAVGTGADTAAKLTKGSALQVLRVNAGGTALEWATPTGGTTIANDTIWDAAADLVVGTGADTSARLAKGTALQVLRMNSGATAIEWADAASGGGAVLDDTAPTWSSGSFWYQPTTAKLHVGIDNFWVEVGRDGRDGSDGADGDDGADSVSSASTGTVLSLTTTSGYYYNMSSASAATTFTTTGTTLGSFAISLINTTSQPTVTGATLIPGATWVTGTDMHLVVQYFGTTVQYYFLSLT